MARMHGKREGKRFMHPRRSFAEEAGSYPERLPITHTAKKFTGVPTNRPAWRVVTEGLEAERLKRIGLLEQQSEAYRSAIVEAGANWAACEELQHKLCTALVQVGEQRAARDEAERRWGAALEQVSVQRVACSEVERKLISAVKCGEEEREAREKATRQLTETLCTHKTVCEVAKDKLVESDVERIAKVACKVSAAIQQANAERFACEELESQLAAARSDQQSYARRLAEAERQEYTQRALHAEALKHQEMYARKLLDIERQADSQMAMHEDTKGKFAEALKHQATSASRLEEVERQACSQRASHKEKEEQLADTKNAEQIFARRLDDAVQQLERNRKSLPDATHLIVQFDEHKGAREAAEKKAAMVLEQLEEERKARRATEVKEEELKTAAQTNAVQNACQHFEAAARHAKFAHEGQEWEALQRAEEELRQQVQLLAAEQETAERQLAESNQSLLTQRSALASLELGLSKICGNMDEAVSEWLPWEDLKEVRGQLKTTQRIVREALIHHEVVYSA